MIRPNIRRLFRIALRRPDVVERDVEDEIRMHIALRAEQLVRGGLTPDAAMVEAVRRFGQLRDASRDLRHSANERDRTMRVEEWLDALRQDIKYAARGLRRAPLFTAFVVVTLALGIGANAAMFGVVDRLLVRGPEHIIAPSRVMRVYMTVKPSGMDPFSHPSFGYVTYDVLRRDTQSFDAVAAYAVNARGITLGRGADAQLLTVGYVTSDIFPLLGVRAAVGRFFTADEDRTSGAEHVAVLGHGLWQRAFAGDPSVLGRSITLGDQPYTVIGIAPKGFTGPQLGRVDVWLPMSIRGATTSPDWTTTWNAQWHFIVVRLKPGVTPAQAGIAATAAYQRAYAGGDTALATAKLSVAPISFNVRAKEMPEAAISRWLLGVAFIVLLIACSNVVNLLLARSVRRQREMAVRRALGAGRARLVRLLLTEGLLLALLGGTAGLMVAWLTAQLMRTVFLPGVEWTSSAVDARVLVVSAAISITVGLMVGVIPAIRASRPDLTASLKVGVREGGGQGTRLRSALTVTQAALSLLLLVGAGLFVRSLLRVHALDLGIEPEKVLVVSPRWPSMNGLDTVSQRIERTRRRDLYPRAVERVRQLAEVERASLAAGISFKSSFSQYLRVTGWDSIPELKGGGPFLSAVSSDYFETVGTRVVRGRAFTPADRAGSEHVALISETMARTLWRERDPIGDCLFTHSSRDSLTTCSRIVGVVGDARRFELREGPAMHYYLPLGQETGFGGTDLLIRPRGSPSSMVATARRVLQELDPSISYVDARTLQESLDPQIRPWRLGASMFGLMGVLALIVAAVGLYSVMSYLVAQRTHEIGVRIALGARSGDILGLVLRRSLTMAALGVAIGLALALAAGRFVEPLLFDTSPTDVVVLGGVTSTLFGVALIASLVPAWRAKRVNPMEALRTE